MSSEAAHLEAVLEALHAVDAVPYTISQAKRVQVLPPAYNEVTLIPRAGGDFRLSARAKARGFYLVVKACARTYDGALTMREAARNGLLGARLTVDGSLTSPLIALDSEAIDDDGDGWYVGPTQYTYVH